MLAHIGAVTKEQGRALAIWAHSLAASFVYTMRGSASPADMFTNDHNQSKNHFSKVRAFLTKLFGSSNV